MADLQIAHGETEIRIDLRDNGIGFDLPATPHGLGLQLIRERLESIGGLRPIRPANLLVKYPASTKRVYKPEGCAMAA